MPQSPDSRRLDHARALASHLHEALGLSLAIELWDGSRVPADSPADGLRVAITDPAALPQLVRHPGLATLVKLYAAGALDLRGGDFFDLAAQRPAVRSRDIRRRLKLGTVARHAVPFLFGPADLKSEASADVDGGNAATRRSGSAKADIAFHYDVSNRFYQLFLDPEMVYTCAYFTDWSNDLATAQHDKLEMICRKLRLKPGDRLLDIGCGWGALICHAAEHYGVTALGVTLAEEQLSLARERIAARGLADRVSVELRDYRDLADGTFDKIASIGMFEHVGIDNHAGFFKKVHSLLAPGGLYLHHAITRKGKLSDIAFRKKRTEYKAMTRYIFPGGEVDHIGMTLRNLEAYRFEVHDVEGWREHYGRTTELWARNLMANREAAIAEVGEARYRIWLLYLCGVSLAFKRGTLQIFQTLVSKRQKGPSGLPPTRADLYR